MANGVLRVQGSGFSTSHLALALRLGACLIVVVVITMVRGRTWPRRWSDELWDVAEFSIVPVLAFFAGGGARSGVPLLVYGGIAAGIIGWARLGFLTGRGYYDEWSHVREIVWIAMTCIISSRLAASLRWWWIARRRRRSIEPRCAECGYSLIGLPEPRCPECGTPFDVSGLATKDIDAQRDE
jgi:hypothetical protein